MTAPWPIRAGASVAKTLSQIARRYGETDLALAVADTLREAARVLVGLTIHADSADAMADTAALGAALAEVLGRLAREARSS